MSVTALPGPADSETDEARATPATPSIVKALQVLEAFRDSGPTLGVSDVVRLVGVPKSTAFRLLSHLTDCGYIERSGRHYTLGSRLFELGNAVQMCRPNGLRGLALPYLGELYATTGKVAHLAVLDGTDIVYVEKSYGLKAMPVDTVVGGRTPAACTALGKAILAFSDRRTIGRVLQTGLVRRTTNSHSDPAQFLAELRRVHLEHVAHDREESSLGLACLAAPILLNGRAVGAISVSGRAGRTATPQLHEQVRRAADAITTRLRQAR